MSKSIHALCRQPLKVLDYELARAIGRSVETVRSYRVGRLAIPAEVRARMLQWRAERAIQQIAEGREELARIQGEARAHDIAMAPSFERLLENGRRLFSLGSLGSAEGRDGDTSRDDAAEASR